MLVLPQISKIQGNGRLNHLTANHVSKNTRTISTWLLNYGKSVLVSCDKENLVAEISTPAQVVLRYIFQSTGPILTTSVFGQQVID